MPLTETEEIEYLELLEQEERESVIPKLECFRKPARYKLAHGGRGSGKSRGIGSLLCQLAQSEPKKILCTREVQLSLEESVYAVIVESLTALKYTGWTITKEAITHANGSRFIFRGLKDLRAANAVKSMEGIDICWIEEAQSVSEESLKVLIPTIRKEGSEIWASWNPETDNDPIMAYTQKSDAVVVNVNWNDNPWFPDVLKKEMEDDFRTRPDEAEHIWNGQPRKQGDNCVFSRTSIREAMEREIVAEGAIEIGLDVARFGGDSTQGYKRKGLKTIDHFELTKADTNQVVDRLYTFAGGSSGILCKIDEGYNPGVVDVAKSRGINVDAISFGGQAGDSDLYPNKISEMWFTFPINEAQIPNDPRIMEQMSDRRYSYDSKGRRCIESKDEYKKRHNGKSPDCFVAGTMVKTINGDKAIESIDVGDYVYTPFGIQKVIKNWKTETDELTNIVFSDGRELSCKKNHRIYTNNGFIPACELHGFVINSFSWRKILTWQIKSLFYTKARSISFKQAADTIQSGKVITEQDFFIGSFGLNTMDQFQKDTRFIILIRIGATMIYPILKWLKLANTYISTWKSIMQSVKTEKSKNVILQILGTKQVNGMDQTKGCNGIRNMEKKRGLVEKKKQQYAKPVVKSFQHISDQKQSIVQNHAQTNIQENTQRQHKKYVQSAEKNIMQRIRMSKKQCVVAERVVQNFVGKTTVYNLTLKKHNAYYANGILVENCVDALLLCYYEGSRTTFDNDFISRMEQARNS